MSGRGPELWRQSQCCGGQREEIVQVDLFGDGRTIGLVALNQIFEQLFALGRTPHASVQDELLKMVAAKNYVPPKAEAEYAAGLLREYAKFCAKKNKERV
jgi:hypothetical protein